jgi:hypothetical protein
MKTALIAVATAILVVAVFFSLTAILPNPMP